MADGAAFGAPGCKNADDDPHAELGDDYKAELGQWCTTKKACAVFIWLTTGMYLLSDISLGLPARVKAPAPDIPAMMFPIK